MSTHPVEPLDRGTGADATDLGAAANAAAVAALADCIGTGVTGNVSPKQSGNTRMAGRKKNALFDRISRARKAAITSHDF